MFLASACLAGIDWTVVELRHLRYFVVAAETENVSRAALKLHVSRPALSRQIRDLEDEIGFCLLERTAKSVSLTDAARTFLNDASTLLQQTDEAVKKAHSVAHPGETEVHVGSALCCSFARSSVMLKRAIPIVLAALVIAPTLAQSQRTRPGTSMIPPTYPQRGVIAQEPAYFPERFDWQHKKPEDVGMSTGALADAVQLAVADDTPGTHDMALFLKDSFGKEPFDTLIGPIKDRGPASGLITRHGYIVTEWGDPRRVDITNSVTKTFLTTVVGLAWQKGLIHDVNDYVRDYMPPHVDLFESEHNAKIKWDHLLRQTSDWQGTLWGKPDWADRPVGDTPDGWAKRKLWEPGTHFKYNDVRVNVMALAALQVWRRPLPEVLRENVMEPIGASSTWRWYGYENSWVDIDGQKVQSVSGGGHWGGGMFINSYDMARFGYLFLRNGKWKDRTIVSEKWIEMARTPGSDNKTYGYANWYLNTDRKPLPAAPASAVRFVGNGANIIYIDWDNDIVAVFRWIKSDEALNDVIAKMMSSMQVKTTAAQ